MQIGHILKRSTVKISIKITGPVFILPHFFPKSSYITKLFHVESVAQGTFWVKRFSSSTFHFIRNEKMEVRGGQRTCPMTHLWWQSYLFPYSPFRHNALPIFHPESQPNAGHWSLIQKLKAWGGGNYTKAEFLHWNSYYIQIYNIKYKTVVHLHLKNDALFSIPHLKKYNKNRNGTVLLN